MTEQEEEEILEKVKTRYPPGTKYYTLDADGNKHDSEYYEVPENVDYVVYKSEPWGFRIDAGSPGFVYIVGTWAERENDKIEAARKIIYDE